MKKTQLREFVEEFLEEQGSKFLRREKHLLEVEVPKGVALDWPSKQLALAFTKKTHERHPDAELLTVGHPLLERILDLCGAEGRYSCMFEPLPKRKGRRPSVSSAAGLPELDGGWTWQSAVEAYRPLTLLAFVIKTSTMDAPDEFETVLLDPWTGEDLGEGAAEAKAWGEEMQEGASDRQKLPFPDMERVLKWGLGVLDRRIRRRIEKLKGKHGKDLDQEIGNIENYYRQLIDELRSGGRRTSLTPQEREEKIRLLQLDWKRRIHEATEYLRPRITVRLSAVGVLYRPCWAVEALPPKKKGKGRIAGHWAITEHGSGRWKPPVCGQCGQPVGNNVVATSIGFVCENCLQAPASVGVN